jgi:hypothetical protein
MSEWQPEAIRRGALDMQVCVPSEWTDDEIVAFANREYLCGTENGWFIRREGDKALAGFPERNPCTSRTNFVHVTLDA